MQKNKGASILMIVVLVAFIAIPYFYGSKKSTTTTEDKKTESGTSWFSIYTPAKTVTPTTTTKTTSTTKTTTSTTKTTTKTVATTTKEIVDPNQSKYAKKIEISSVSGGSSDPKKESITIKNIDDKESISITGFLIETYSRENFKIAKGYELPGLPSSVEGNIVLKPGDQAIIYVGTQERKINFRENLCTGYFNEYSNFNGKLSNSCPEIDISQRLDFSANCIKVINAIPTCRMFNPGIIVESNCNDFATTHYSYAGCVNDFKTRTNFYSKKWLVWMQRSMEFFRNDMDLIILKDTEGKIVDKYQY